MLRMSIGTLRERSVQSGNLLIALAFALSGLMPIILMKQASAAQLTARKVLISNSTPDATGVTYDFTFTTQSSTTIQSLSFQFCNTPLGTCVLPGTDGTPTAAEKIDVSQVTASTGGFTGTTANGFADYTGADAGGCTEADGGSGVATQFCATRTQATPEAAGIKTFSLTGVSNPIISAGNNEPVYVRVVTYSDTAFATAVDQGTVAASIVNQLTVTGRVQERLVFCVFALDDTAGSSATVGTAATNMPTDCTASEATASTSVDIGTIDNSTIAKSPVNNTPPTSLGNDRFAAAMLNTNATGGVALTYYPTLASSGTNELRAFRVAGASCNVSGTDITDQCFVSAATTGTGFVAGTEKFGTQIACIANSATNSTGTTANLGKNGAGTYTSGSGAGGSFNTAYSNTDDSMVDDGSDDCENSDIGVKFAWDASGTAVPLISSVTVVDDELVKMRYGATASATTPTGTYTVATTYIATATF